LIHLITGIAGQDGLILGHKLLNRSEKVIGLCKPTQTDYVKEILPECTVYGINDLGKKTTWELLEKVKPNFVYNFLGFSSVQKSWLNQQIVFQTNYSFPLEILNWIVDKSRDTKFIQASSSEIFGNSKNAPQEENTPHSPITPYGFSKSLIHKKVDEYRVNFKIFACNAIFYNHESPLRSKEFVTRKISKSIASLIQHKISRIELGNLEAKRDWGWAPDYMDALDNVIRFESPENVIIATGKLTSVSELLSIAFDTVGIDNYYDYIDISSDQVRAIDPNLLVGNSQKINDLIGWKSKHTIKETMEKLIEFDLKYIDDSGNSKIRKWLNENVQVYE
jgi:GDPmannose 4,6-dehydratase